MSQTAFRTAVDGDAVVVRYPDPARDAGSVRLWSELDLGGPRASAGRRRLGAAAAAACRCTGWSTSSTSTTGTRTDPTNPRIVDGAFGEHSWLAAPRRTRRPPGSARAESPSELAGSSSRTPRSATSTSGLGAGRSPTLRALPLLLAHDGPEFATYAGLTHYAGAMIAAGTLPPAPARPARTRTARNVLVRRQPAVRRRPDAPRAARGAGRSTRARPAGADGRRASGALAALHAEWTIPGTFAGLFLQSGSFFTPEPDPQESKFEF